jgi:hypothetical protein
MVLKLLGGLPACLGSQQQHNGLLACAGQHNDVQDRHNDVQDRHNDVQDRHNQGCCSSAAAHLLWCRQSRKGCDVQSHLVFQLVMVTAAAALLLHMCGDPASAHNCEHCYCQ